MENINSFSDMTNLTLSSNNNEPPREKTKEIRMSMEEFHRMHEELMALKTEKYESDAKIKRLNQEVKSLKESNPAQAQVLHLQTELVVLKKEYLTNLEQHQQTSGDLKELQSISQTRKAKYAENISQLSDENLKLRCELDALKGVVNSPRNSILRETRTIPTLTPPPPPVIEPFGEGVATLSSMINMDSDSGTDTEGEFVNNKPNSPPLSTTSSTIPSQLASPLDNRSFSFDLYHHHHQTPLQNGFDNNNNSNNDYSEKIDGLIKEKEQLFKENEQLQHQIEDLQSGSKYAEEKNLLEQEINRLHDVLEASENTIDDLNKELEEANGVLLSEQSVLASWEERFVGMIKSNEELRIKAEGANNLANNKQKEIKNLKDELSVVQKKLSSSQHKQDSISNTMLVLEKELQKAVSRERAVAETLNKETESKKTKEGELEEKESSMANMKSILSNLTDTNAKLRETIELYKNRENEAENVLKEKNENLELKKVELEEEIEILKLDKNCHLENIKNLESKIKGQADKATNLEYNNKKQEKKTEQIIKDLKKELAKAQSQANEDDKNNKKKPTSTDDLEAIKDKETRSKIASEIKRLRQQNNFYEEHTKQLTKENKAKTQVIQLSALQYYAKKHKKEIIDGSNEGGIAGLIWGSHNEDSVLKSVNDKLQLVLEDVLNKNTQLQKKLSSYEEKSEPTQSE